MTELFATCHCFIFIFNCKLSTAALFVNTSVESMSYFSGQHLTLAYKYTLVNSDRGSGLRARSVANTDMFRTRHRPRSASLAERNANSRFIQPLNTYRCSLHSCLFFVHTNYSYYSLKRMYV